MKHSIALVRAALRGAALAGLLGTAVGISPSAQAAPAVLSDPNLIADVAEKVTPSVVSVYTTTRVAESPFAGDPFFEDFFGRRGRERSGQSLGSGVVVSAKGYVLTNNHVVANSTDVKVALNDGRELPATVVGTDPKSDVAVLRLKGNVGKLKPIAIGDSSKLRLGEIVLAVGNPFGIGQSVTMGIVSAKGRSNMPNARIADYEDFIQTDAAINPGNSGGALVNLRGELVGINTAILSKTGGYQGIGLAIPTNMARPIMDSLIAKGKVVRGWLGVSIQDLTRELSDSLKLGADRGVLVNSVVAGSPAARAGLRRGDVVVRVGNATTDSATHLRNAVASLAVGKPIKVEFIREGKHQTVDVVLAEQPVDGEAVAEQGGGARGSQVKLGLRVAPLDKAMRQKLEVPRDIASGVVVTDVARGGVGDQIGLQAGDVIVQLNRTDIKSARQLDDEYRKAKGKLALLLFRDGATVYVVVSK
jgi:serine protease Do